MIGETVYLNPDDLTESVDFSNPGGDRIPYIPLYRANALVASALEPWQEVRSDSHGIAGYHLNGDIAYWDEFDLPETPADVIAAREARRRIEPADSFADDLVSHLTAKLEEERERADAAEAENYALRGGDGTEAPTHASRVVNLYSAWVNQIYKKMGEAQKRANQAERRERALLSSNKEERTARCEAESLRFRVKRLEAALKPFAARVFNDNGDITVTDTYRVGYEDYVRAYHAHRGSK